MATTRETTVRWREKEKERYDGQIKSNQIESMHHKLTFSDKERERERQ